MTTTGTRDGSTGALEARYRARSLWLDQLSEPLTPRPSLPGDIETDVVIVGAGFTGLWTAYYLKREQPDLRVAVLEAEIAGYGPSGRNGGWASGGIAGSPGAYAKRSDSGAIPRAIRETYATVDEIGEVAAREGIDCGYAKAGMLTLATTGPQEQRLTAGVRAAHDQGIAPGDMTLLSPAEVAEHVEANHVRAGAFSPHGARINPAQLVRGLARACERLGVGIYERTRALSLTPGEAQTDQGT